MRVTAIDENGMGPQLGPLVVTALSISVDDYERARLRRLGRNAGIGDSKQVSSFGNMAWCESLSLALVEVVSGSVPDAADSLIDQMSVESCDALRTRCPKRSMQQCWAEALPLPALGGDIDQGRLVVRRMRRWGVDVKSVRSRVLCVRHFNQAFDQMQSKTTVDLQQMRRLLQDARQSTPKSERHQAICGMVGGIRSYPKYWRKTEWEQADGELETLHESRKVCSYAYPGFEQISFEVDADERHMPVSLASMIGKYMREIWMLRQNRFYQKFDASLPSASGYHDSVTKRHIEQSRTLRRRLNVSRDCFLRVR